MSQDELKTPCFIIRDEILRKNLTDFKRIVENVYPDGIIGYSFKTNSTPYILTKALEYGCYAEVVSDTEYCLAEKIGFPTDKIIYNGPIKSKETFKRAFFGRSVINIDSFRELQWLKEFSNNEMPRSIGIRVNFDLESALPGETSTGAKGGRFGFSLENGDLHRAIAVCQNIAGVKPAGLHMHVSSKTKSVNIYQKLSETACRIIEDEELDIEYLDIGGGFFGGNDNGEAYGKYISVIHDELERHGVKDICLIAEPGASVVATAVDYMSSVIEYKDTSYGRFVITDGSRLHIDPFFRKDRHLHTMVSQSEKLHEKQTICGFTCMENDRIMTVENESELQAGDKIVYYIEGSYSMCFNSLFIEYLPYVYAEENGSYKLVRDKWGIEEYLQKSYIRGRSDG